MLAWWIALLTHGTGQGLPTPTGSRPVGTRVSCWIDRSRPAPTGEGSGRPIMVQLWYPAAAPTGPSGGPVSGKGPAPYVPDPNLLELMIDQGYYGQTPELIRSWTEIDTHARLDAEPAADGPFPVLLFSH